jgi:hypothetical protein
MEKISIKWLGTPALLFALFLIGYKLPEIIVSMGRRIPQSDLVGDYVKALLLATVLFFVLLLVRMPAPDRKPMLLLWGAKVLVTLGFMLFYENHYGLDAYEYFNQPRAAGFHWEGFAMGGGTQNMMHLSWLQQQLIPDSYHALKISCAFIGLLAVYIFYRAWVYLLGREDLRVFYFVAFFPSVLFWSSILGKDPIVLLGIALYAYGVCRWARRRDSAALVAIMTGVLLATFIRVWMGPIMLAPLMVLAVMGMRGIVPRAIFFSVIIGLMMLTFGKFQDRFKIESEEDVYQTTTSVSSNWSHGGSGQAAGAFNSPAKIVSFAPLGIFTALFRPLPGEVLNPFGIIAGLENLVLLILCWKSWRSMRFEELKRDPLLLWGVLFVLVWATIYGFISYQNMGSASRFKLQVLPVMLGLIFYWMTKDQAQEAR